MLDRVLLTLPPIALAIATIAIFVLCMYYGTANLTGSLPFFSAASGIVVTYWTIIDSFDSQEQAL